MEVMTIAERGPENLADWDHFGENKDDHCVDVGIQPAVTKNSIDALDLSEILLNNRVSPQPQTCNMEVVVRRKSRVLVVAKYS
jgi:hypothetical protein